MFYLTLWILMPNRLKVVSSDNMLMKFRINYNKEYPEYCEPYQSLSPYVAARHSTGFQSLGIVITSF